MNEINTAATGTENPAAEAAATSAKEGNKTFTQEQLNAIVGERLAKEKAKTDAALAERERELAQRELLLSAREKITAKGLPPELLDALNISSPEALEKSLTIIESYIKPKLPEIKGVSPMQTNSRPTGDTSIREAMGLK